MYVNSTVIKVEYITVPEYQIEVPTGRSAPHFAGDNGLSELVINDTRYLYLT